MTKCRFATSAIGEVQLPVFSATVNDGRMVNQAGLSRKHIFDAVQASVKRLGTYIDVLQIQRMDPDVSREEIMRALNDVVEMGLVRYLGASSVSQTLYTYEASLSLHSKTRCLLGSFSHCKMWHRSTVGINSFPCKTTITSSTVRKSGR
jgi:aryl-alcohol dehydrogenase-like predicted oxidoreductase